MENGINYLEFFGIFIQKPINEKCFIHCFQSSFVWFNYCYSLLRLIEGFGTIAGAQSLQLN